MKLNKYASLILAFSLLPLISFAQSPLPKSQRINGIQVRQALEDLANYTKESIVKISNIRGKTVANGVIVKKNGLILTKASELSKSNFVTLQSGKKLKAYLVGTDAETDLALIKIMADDLTEITFGKNLPQEIGNWVISPLYGQSTKIGIVSATKRDIDRVTGVLGVLLGQDDSKGISISNAVKNGPAYAAGLRGGDILTHIDKQALKTREDLLDYLKDKGPGVKVQIEYLQNNKTKNTDLILGDRTQTFKDFNRNLEMSGTISKRIDGFKNVIQHDIPLEHFEIGAPLLSISGKVIAFNIARANRSEAYALSNKVVNKALTKLLKLKLPDTNRKKTNEETHVSLVQLKTIQSDLKKLLPQTSKVTVGLVINGSSGSGVLISKDGYILTAAHVSQKPGSKVVIIMPDGKKYKGKSLGSHLKGDIGLVKITDKVELPFAKIAKANDHNKGDWCFALGYPGGFNKERGSVVRIGKFIEIKPNLIWTDCTLLGGDSGGPLFNFKGEIVGINSRIFATSEDNLHGPAELYLTHKSALEKGDIIRSNRRKPSPFLGVATTPAGKGLSVTEVVENSSADKAGIITGDIILKIGNKDLNDTESLIKILKKKKIGQNIDIKISREGKEIELSTVLGKRP